MYLLNILLIYIVFFIIGYTIIDYVSYLCDRYDKYVEQEKENQMQLWQSSIEEVIEPLKTKIDEIYEWLSEKK
ncbi:ORF MSV163 hypothetical protein [Melanoplus sanguinipes entomopoxvirus]|uniref:Uncharacterized protein n=1 Tax=Melanoplus sanguinipes entomopoxvirus TaxID=83191 RepID=Q9YVS9_MSEPV|nr:ORF MSV163 hypothetical protein [Melanoplus sanguinipes entomopoxvirus]AAC97777.1 ORF MSV163 hypothetical protein [Melanoplus sanguinipes entomopoxvirus 'O']